MKGSTPSCFKPEFPDVPQSAVVYVTTERAAHPMLSSQPAAEQRRAHTQLIYSATDQQLGLEERYRAAAGVIARIGSCVDYTLLLIWYLQISKPDPTRQIFRPH